MLRFINASVKGDFIFHGVSQGSVVGTILLNIYGNALCGFKCQLSMYADNNALITSHKAEA